MDKIKELAKKHKIITGIIVLSIIGMFVPNDNSNIDKNKHSEIKEVAVEQKKEPSRSKEELIDTLDTYDKMYSNHLEGIDKIASENDPIAMQKSFAQTRDISEMAFTKIVEIKGEYEVDSQEYKALNELQVAFNTLSSACKDGIKYIDKQEYKYLEKYEKHIKEANLFIANFQEAKSNIN
ncbi:hypothetical protein CHF27_006425 [Romboutsia maritimum]|uniref:Uncharacterized protein n=1 Tax=Romboutsia maritimum TaxID=2020948 RepID=A0A371ITG9_9FIRM|nr:hypothetical protein [Romboutsia maritimum]RDY23755.1 hypothetical protein CHF27_006425 [Romboutsia maritimum]